jgi:adenine-specific DNA methylase
MAANLIDKMFKYQLHSSDQLKICVNADDFDERQINYEVYHDDMPCLVGKSSGHIFSVDPDSDHGSTNTKS